MIDLELYSQYNTQKGLVLAYNALKYKVGAVTNLDMDMINVYQMVNKVVSLDEHWLWCDVWCSHDLKDDAIFIDQCKKPYDE